MFNRCFADPPAPTSIKRVCVFCGARRGRNPLFTQIASELGRELARAGLGIIYGGGGSGLMGALARAALQSGGAVTGVMPRFLAEREEALLDNHEFILVDDMGARKSEIAARADAFIALPGGSERSKRSPSRSPERSLDATQSQWCCSTPQIIGGT
jgi:predicted Rossmann-fold nucleotide-binding protein